MDKIYITEIWKPIYGYETYYQISNTGSVRSLPRIIKLKKGARKVAAKTIKPRLNNSGYLEVRLSKYDITSTKFVHGLLAETFIPNPERKKEVNHKSGIKTDNRLSNLEWCSHAENMKHAYQLGLCKSNLKQSPVIDICSGKTFPSIRKAAEFNDLKYATCKGYLSGTRTNPTCLRYLNSNAA